MNAPQPPAKNAAKAARYSPELWTTIRKLWEGDPVMSYAQAVKLASVQYGSDVPTKGACSTYSRRNGWVKHATTEDPGRTPDPDQGPSAPEAQPTASAVATFRPVEARSESLLNFLTDRQRLFALEYMFDLNATAAYMRAFTTDKKTTAATEGARLLRNPCIKAFVEANIRERAERCETDADMVLLAWRDIATADANDICEYRRECCRYCYGLDHRYHFTPAEMDDARKKHDQMRLVTLAETDNKVDLGEFDQQGGVGFNGRLDPNPDCPECFGDGIGRAHFKDTRKLSAGSRALYGGLKIGRDGLELKIHSKDGALDSIARHNQMFVEKMEVGFTDFDPATLARRFGKAMAAGQQRMQEIRDERKPRGTSDDE